MAVYDERCVACGRKTSFWDDNHHCTPCDRISIDDEPELEWVEDRWEEVDELERLNYGLELMESD